MNLFFLALVLLFPSLLSARDLSVTFLVYKASFTQTQLDAIESSGHASNPQPVKITDVFATRNTDYLLVTVTSVTFQDNTRIMNAYDAGKIQPTRAVEIVSEWDPRIGGVVTYAVVRDNTTNPNRFISLPSVVNKSWA